VSSTRDLAVELAKLAAVRQRVPTDSGDNSSNTRLRVNAAELSQILKQNQESLITKNMLEKGTSRQQAGAEAEMLFAIIDQFAGLEFDYRVKPDEMLFELVLKQPNVSK
jgi:hypothetical protein